MRRLFEKLYGGFGREALFALDAERAHGVSICALQKGLHPVVDAAFDSKLAVNIAGLSFPNPLGMAAGFDKNADVPDALLRMGFGHTEVGTVTPLPQPGNPKPRIFRLRDHEAVINRLGFNSKGHDAALARLKRRRNRSGIVGINIGANKTSENFAADYVAGIKAFADVADYFTVNISSPNTPGLRALQGADPLADLLDRVSEARAQYKPTAGNRVPVFLKIAPDLSEEEMDTIAAAVLASDVDALIVSNTTVSRSAVADHQTAREAGGLSGKPIFELSTTVLAKMYQRLNGRLPLIGVGGIHDAESARQKIEAGASLIQLYTGLIYKGPALPTDIINGLSLAVKEAGVNSISDLCGRSNKAWASRNLPD